MEIWRYGDTFFLEIIEILYVNDDERKAEEYI